MRAAKRGGRIAICGSTSGPKMELTIPHLFFRQLELIGSSMGTHGQFARAAEWIGSARAKAPVGKVFDFEELPEALAYLDSGEQTGQGRPPSSGVSGASLQHLDRDRGGDPPGRDHHRFFPSFLSWFGHLPGDIRYQGENTQVFIPITSMLVVSVVATVIFNLAARLFGSR